MSNTETQSDSEREHERTITIAPGEPQMADNRKSVSVPARFFLIGVVCCTTLLLLLLLTSRDPTHNHNREKRQGSCQVDMCLTEECIHAASSILKSMDPAVDPCEDFYTYACGGWIKDNAYRTGLEELFYGVNHNGLPEQIDLTISELIKRRVPMDRKLMESKPYRDLFAFYDTCTEVGTEEGDMQPLLEVLLKLKHFQVGRPFERDAWNLTNAILELMRLNGVPLFDVLIDADIRNSSKFAIIIAPPRRYGLIPSLVGPSLPSRRRPDLEKILRSKSRKGLFGDTMDDLVLLDMLTEIRAQKRSRHVMEGADNNFRTAENTINDKRRILGKSNGSDASPSPASAPSTRSFSATELPNYESLGDDYVYEDEQEVQVVSRRTVYQIFKRNVEMKRIEMIAKMVEDIFDNSTEEDVGAALGDITPDDILTYVVQMFIPHLTKIQPNDYEELEAQQHAKLYNHYTLSQLQQETPLVDWSYLLSSLFNKTITEEDSIYLYYPQYMVSLNHLLATAEPWVVHYGMLVLYSFDVLRETIYASDEMDRADFCLQASKRAFGEVLTNMYLHHVGNETINHIRKHTEHILGTLREEVKSSVTNASWLSPEDMNAALDKLLSLEAEIGAYDKHWNLTFVNVSHAGIHLSENNTFRDNVLEIYRVLRTELYYLYKEPVDRFSFIWSFTVQPYIVNAFHMHSTNTIVFPEAFFHAPYYTKKGPEYLNYGSAATAMAHEIFHGIDFTGILFDSRGEMTLPFSNASRDHLQSIVRCYDDLLNKAFYEEVAVEDAFIAMEIDSSTTFNENLADIGGIRHAFRAYQRWERTHYQEPRLPALPLSPHQLFFVSAAQPYCAVIPNLAKILLMELDEHLPNGMRINAMMMNTPEFAKVFQCNKGSRMVANKTCHIF
ncbi:endothelin-converting enzyme homolog [Penaeus japonicus]|uniref:endothelin-converting enzyme homolog n=1 Tax=Penaeus japonicus TaxID=27405 RepID=UPI001C712F4B|nr:endothelin-converting enzyme homolog [Penaeus japonicus]XP_042882067.1 endothelin-converting enzyme homolog [Penaeus japonicus]XP_042882068.1 endothelin-converting enzyme homolog [Penaeus japonicus]XP_042882069.1 endothelin-converting enzyme homolog [Penaeus japonicus]XP_042882070.1 endothelin-converting enzyme homolog [Penaeus japonicus]XP_042882071.1 endothelin-converting enzyme homolog [Penaeus japonicus]XP_042882072.1 endothelin-converting enzyme homolog [Penaeus japonicus]